MPTSEGQHARGSQRRSSGSVSASQGDRRPKKQVRHRRAGADSTGTHAPAGRSGVRSGHTGDLGARGGQRRVREGSGGHKSNAPKHASAPRRRGLPIGALVGIVVLVLVLGVGGFLLVTRVLAPYEGARVEDGQTVTVVIPEGSDGGTITKALLDAGVIHNSRAFRKAAQQQNADQNLKSGTYTFRTGEDPEEVVRQLVEGPNSVAGQLQVPEGLTLAQTASVVEASLGISEDEFLAQAKASNYVSDYPFLKEVSNDSLEGYLYPKTYDFAGKEATADMVIRQMLSQFDEEFGELDTKAARAKLSERFELNVTDYDLIKLASIIEEEALSEDDRPKVSSVFYNRLSAGMALESDATMGYETGGAVTPDDLRKDSPYNTYLYKGLPPTPICSPSMWAIEAAMYPDDTDLFYFYIIEQGDYKNHTFSKTYEEHEAAVAKAREELARLGSGAGSGATSGTPASTAGSEAEAVASGDADDATNPTTPTDEG